MELFSRVSIWGNPYLPTTPFGWGKSEKLPEDIKIKQFGMWIDGHAYSPMTYFEGKKRRTRNFKI